VASRRRDPRLATLIVLGGWFLVEAAVLSLSKGIVHPYYASALAPGTGAMAGAGAVALVALLRGRLRWWALALLFCLLMVAPGAYAATTWLAPVEGTFPAAGPKAAAGAGGVGVSGRH